MGYNCLDIQVKWQTFLNTFSWKSLPRITALEFLLPITIGMALIAFLCGLVSFSVVLFILSLKKKNTQ